MRRRRWLKRIAIILVIIAVPAAVIIGVNIYESRSRVAMSRGTEHVNDHLNTVEINGSNYRRRSGLDTVLLIGVDKQSDGSSAPLLGFRRGGQADFLRLLVIDSAANKVTHLQIDRDTVTPIMTFNVQGEEKGKHARQIALSHSYGDGGQESSKNTVNAVSELLFNAPVDQYMAMNLDGIPVLNDAVGGVTVTLKDDLSSLDPALIPGATVTLHGKQAEYYVRSRMGVGHGTNEERMQRQQDYISKLTDRLRAKISEDKNFAGDLYDVLTPYLVTSLTRGNIINDAWQIKDYTHEVVTIPGQHSKDDFGYVTFMPDIEALKSIVIDLFYEKVE